MDYEKLKKAHELAKRYGIENEETCVVIHHYYGRTNESSFYLQTSSQIYFSSNCIDELITKLEELTRPKPKYELGQKVWIYDYHDKECRAFFVDAINLDELKYSGDVVGSSAFYEEISEFDIYRTQEALIKAQIEHWQSLRNDMILDENNCDHESDGNEYFSHPFKSKCWKCKEFY